MKKAVLMAFSPKECEKIFSGEKTVDVRKIAPKLETPYKAYVYQTKGKEPLLEVIKDGDDLYGEVYHGETVFVKGCHRGLGKVVGEFVCDTVEENIPDYNPAYERFFYNSFECGEDCLTSDEIAEYGKGDPLHGLHITKPKRYDIPKALSEFYRRLPDKVLEEGNYDCRKDWNMVCIDYPEMSDLCDDCIFGGRVQLTRPPQSWMYVEEIEE